MYWIPHSELARIPAVKDFEMLLQVMLDDRLSEFQYVPDNGGVESSAPLSG